jgi:hypothetical protein
MKQVRKLLKKEISKFVQTFTVPGSESCTVPKKGFFNPKHLRILHISLDSSTLKVFLNKIKGGGSKVSPIALSS